MCVAVPFSLLALCDTGMKSHPVSDATVAVVCDAATNAHRFGFSKIYAAPKQRSSCANIRETVQFQ